MFILLIMGTVFVSRVFINSVEATALAERQDILEVVESATAQRLTWESVSPSVLRQITFFGVRISDEGYARRVTVGINPLSFLFPQRIPLSPTVAVHGARIEIRTGAGWRRLDRTISVIERIDARAPRVTVTVSDSEIDVVRDHRRYAISGVHGVIRIARGGIIEGEVRGTAGVTLTDPEPFSVVGDVEISLQRTDRSTPVEASIDLRRIESSHFLLEDQSFHVAHRRGETRIQRVRSDDPLDLSAMIARDGTVTIDATSAGFVPGTVVEPIGPAGEYAAWLASEITTDSRVVLDGSGAIVSAVGTVSGVLRNDQVLPHRVGFSGSYAVDPRAVHLNRFELAGRRGTLSGSGSYHFGMVGPNGTVSARNFVFGDLPVMSGTATVGTSGGTTGLSASFLEIAGTALHDLTASYTPLESRHAIDLSVAFDTERISTVAASFNIADIEDFSGSISISRVLPSTARDLAGAFGYRLALPEQAVGIHLTGNATVDRRGENLVATVPYAILEDPEHPHRIGTFRGAYRNGTIELDSFFVRYDDVFLDGSGLVHLGSGGTVDFETQFRVNQVPYDLRGLYTPGVSLTVVGPHDFRIRVTRSPRGGIVIAGGVTGIPLPIGESRADFSVSGLFLSETDWYLTVDNLSVTSVPMPGGGSGEARLALSITPETVEVVLLEFRDPVGTLAGRFDVQIGSPPEREIRVAGRVGSIDGTEQYRIAGRYVDGSIALDLRLENAPLRRVNSEIRSGSLSGAIQVVGDGTSPQLRAYLESDTVRVGGQEVRFQGRIYGDDRSIRADDVEIVAASRSLEVSELTVDRENGSIRGAARFERPQGRGTLELAVDGRTDPIPSLEAATIRDLPLALSVRTEYRRPPGGSGEEDVTTHRYSIVKGPSRTELRREDDALRGYILDTGAFEVELSAPLPAQAIASGTIRRGEIELTASGISIDLPGLAGDTVGDAPVSVSRGTVEGSLRVLGPIGDPNVFGTLRIRELEVTSIVSPDTIGPFDAALILEEKTIRLTRFETSVGDAILRGRGTVLLNRLALAEYRLNAEIPGEQGIHIETVFGPIDVDGYARGSVEVTGRPRDLVVNGNVVVSGAEIGVVPVTEGADMTDSINVAVNLSLETGRGVRFIWPAADFPVIRSNFAVGQQIVLQVDGAEETFSLTGDLGIQSGDIFYFDRNFLIRDGEIVFQENQDRFDPRVSARAELREVTPDGPVRIYLIADGQPLSEFSPRFESNPPLGGTEIVAILGGNIFQQGTAESTNLSTALLSTSDIVTQFGVFREFENNVRARLDLDLFAIRTSVIQNLLLTAITPTDETTEQLAPTLGNYLNNTSIFMGRYLGDAVFGQAILQMRSADMEDPDDDDGIQRLGGVLIDSEISLEWQTPFFMLEWSLAPENPEELFIRDNTFTFSWSFSY